MSHTVAIGDSISDVHTIDESASRLLVGEQANRGLLINANSNFHAGAQLTNDYVLYLLDMGVNLVEQDYRQMKLEVYFKSTNSDDITGLTPDLIIDPKPPKDYLASTPAAKYAFRNINKAGFFVLRLVNLSSMLPINGFYFEKAHIIAVEPRKLPVIPCAGNTL